MNNSRFPLLLRTLRTRLGLTQEYVASQIHVDRTTYSGYENGTYEPSLTTLKLLSKIYGVQLQYFDTEEKTPDIDYVSDIAADFPDNPLQALEFVAKNTITDDYNDNIFKVFFSEESDDMEKTKKIPDIGNYSYFSLKKEPLSEDEQLLLTAYRLLSIPEKNSILEQIDAYLSEQDKNP